MIHIIYRHTSNTSGIGKNRPHWFSYKKSLENILNTIEGIDFVKFHLLFDGICNVEHPRIDHIENINVGSDPASYAQAWRYAATLDLTDDDIIYIAENDYAFVDGWPYKLKELFDTYDRLDYVTLYDHPDKYMDPSIGGNPFCQGGAEDTRVYISDSCHWKLTNATTMTFASTVKSLKRTEPTLRKWTQGSYPEDFKMFLDLRDQNELLISSIPGYSTHGETAWLTPLTDWSKI